MNRNIAIDGPAGAGKSTIAKRVAARLGLIYVDTGAMYRAIGLFMDENEIDEKDGKKVAEALGKIRIDIDYIGGEQQIILNGVNVNDKIRTPECSLIASKFAKIPEVRERLVDFQRELAKKTAVVMDGRDIGTHVLKDASVKIFLTADVGIRAKRRFDELIAKGESVSLSDIEEDIKKRDESDMNREVSPLRQAVDAVSVDTSYMSIDEVVCEIIKIAVGKNPAFQVREAY